MEVAVVDIKTGRCSVFGEDKAYAERLYLLYDGIHYDALVRRNGDGSVTTRFASTDAGALAGALRVAREAQAARQFTDMATFTLQCLVCGQGLVGHTGAVDHAKATGHTNFGEYTAGA
jgi:ubiquitin thioesterase OTU1